MSYTYYLNVTYFYLYPLRRVVQMVLWWWNPHPIWIVKCRLYISHPFPFHHWNIFFFDCLVDRLWRNWFISSNYSGCYPVRLLFMEDYITLSLPWSWDTLRKGFRYLNQITPFVVFLYLTQVTTFKDRSPWGVSTVPSFSSFPVCNSVWSPVITLYYWCTIHHRTFSFYYSRIFNQFGLISDVKSITITWLKPKNQHYLHDTTTFYNYDPLWSTL